MVEVPRCHRRVAGAGVPATALGRRA